MAAGLGSLPVPICALCELPRGPLQCLASGGALLSVCQVCFCAEQIKSLAAGLPDESETLALIREGLEVLYQTAKESIEDQLDGAESQSGGRQG